MKTISLSKFLLILLIFLFILPNPLFNSQIIPIQAYDNYHIEKDRILELVFIGTNPDYIQEDYYHEILNHTYSSEFPLGSIFTTVLLSPKFRYVSNSTRDIFTNLIFNQSVFNESDNCFFVKSTTFHTLLIQEIINPLLKITDSTTYYMIILNFAFDTSPFEYIDVYIDYSQPDIDTNQESIVRNVANYGVSFSLIDFPVLGFLMSSIPKFEIESYPYIQDFLQNRIIKSEWNKRIGKLIDQAIWCRINPSPVFRFKVHQTVNIHYSLVYLEESRQDIQNKQNYEILNFINISLIELQIQSLISLSNIVSTLSVVQADSQFVDLLSNPLNNYGEWSDNLVKYLQHYSTIFWNTPYYVNEINNYGQEIDLFLAILVGSQGCLPWSDVDVGLSHSATQYSEIGGLSVITMNYDNLLLKNEGLTQTTQHELSHLLGLSHPHDYWDPTQNRLFYSWIWGYSNTALSYLITSYSYDYFDRDLVFREQIVTILESISKNDLKNKSIDMILDLIESGNYISMDKMLRKVEEMYWEYLDREDFHISFHTIIISTGIMITVILRLFYKKNKR